jgi:hypothetical protein
VPSSHTRPAAPLTATTRVFRRAASIPDPRQAAGPILATKSVSTTTYAKSQKPKQFLVPASHSNRRWNPKPGNKFGRIVPHPCSPPSKYCRTVKGRNRLRSPESCTQAVGRAGGGLGVVECAQWRGPSVARRNRSDYSQVAQCRMRRRGLGNLRLVRIERRSAVVRWRDPQPPSRLNG